MDPLYLGQDYHHGSVTRDAPVLGLLLEDIQGAKGYIMGKQKPSDFSNLAIWAVALTHWHPNHI